MQILHKYPLTSFEQVKRFLEDGYARSSVKFTIDGALTNGYIGVRVYGYLSLKVTSCGTL